MSKIFYGWWVVLALCLVAFFGPMGRYVLTPLFPFLEKEMGWSREAIGLAFTIHLWIYAVISIWTGHLVDTIGGRKTVFMGGVFILVSLPLLSLSQELWQVYLIFGLLLAFGISMTHFVPNTSIARKWFVRKAGLVTGQVMMGTSLGFGILTPIIGHVCGLVGWRMTMLLCGLVFGVVVMCMAAFLIRSTPESMGLHPDGMESKEILMEAEGEADPSLDPEATLGHSLRSRDFWALLISYSVMGIALQGLLAHIVMWAVDLGVAPDRAGLFMAALTLPAVPVRVLGGWLGDRFGKRKILILFTAITAVVWFGGWILVKDTTSLVAFSLVLGFAYSTPFSLYTPFLGDLFGRALVGTLMGAMTFGHGVVGGLGPFLWGWIADTMGSYSPMCAVAGGCYIVSVLGLLMTRPGTIQEERWSV